MTTRRVRGRPPHPDILTPAEWGTVEAVRHGLGDAEIASRRGVSRDAVKFHVDNARSKLALNTRADLRRWSGVRADSNLSGQETTMPEDLALGPLGQISRSVRDIEAARTWYGEVLGLPHLYSFGDLAFFDCDGVRLMLSKGEGGAESLLYFQVADIRAAQAVLSERGVEFTHVPHMIHRHEDGAEEWMAFFADPEGRPLGLMSRTAPSPA